MVRALVAVLVMSLGAPAWSQPYPSRPVKRAKAVKASGARADR